MLSIRHIGLLVGLALGLAACDDPAPEPYVPGEAVEVAVLRIEDWPGGGQELTVRLQSALGEPVTADFGEHFSGYWEDGSPASLRVVQAPIAPGFTAVLVAPEATSESRTRLVAALKAFLASRPASERIGLFRWGTEIHQVGNFTTDPARLQLLAERFASDQPTGSPLRDESALAVVEQLTADLGGPSVRGQRAVVAFARGIEQHMLPSLTGMPVLGVDSSLAGALERVDGVATTLATFAQSSHYDVAVCGPTTSSSLRLRVAGFTGETTVALRASLPEESGHSCEVDAIAEGNRQYPQAVRLEFTPEQREVYDARVAGLSKADFDVSVVLWDDGVPISATAHLRGKGTLGCVRKSFTVKLSGRGRHLFPGSYSDEFYLLSMCADDRYIEQHTANQLMAELGIFPLAFRYVEAVVDGETQGVYLLLEKAAEELQRDNARVTSVMRRRFSAPDDYFEVAKSVGTPAQAVESFEEFLAGLEGLAAEDLEAALAERLDVPQYLTWIALMTAYQNGDFVDELWLVSTEALGRDGLETSWFEPMGWDNDDLFSDCHYGGKYAVVDDNELVYCAESRLDKVIFGDEYLYGRYVDILERLLAQEVPAARFAQSVETTAGQILPFFARPEICAAMVRFIADNPGAIEPMEAQRDVRERLDLLVELYTQRHAVLLERIADYRALVEVTNGQ